MIIHADMDAFFASVEIRERPELHGKPVAVGGRAESRGVIAAASYAARQYGVRSAMPTATALKRCPELVLLPNNMALYAEVSRQIHDIFARYTPLIEPLSIDEAFLDVSASTQLFGSAEAIARRIKQEVRDELRLVVSVGVAPNKFVAKIASDIDKPDGFVVVKESELHSFLDPLPVSRLWGVGKVTEQQLHDRGIHTIGQLRQQSAEQLESQLGQHGLHLHQLAQGIDTRRVTPDREAKSISHETTFARDITEIDTLRAVLLDLTEQVAWRLRRHDYRGRTVQLKLRFDDFRTISRAHSLAQPTQSTRQLWESVEQLFERELARGLPPVRLIGMGVSGFADATSTADDNAAGQQIGLFDTAPPAPVQDQPAAVDCLADNINARFGKRALGRARGVRRPD